VRIVNASAVLPDMLHVFQDDEWMLKKGETEMLMAEYVKDPFPKDELNKQVVKSRQVTIAPEDDFYVSNSGLVLLHPFLEAYFTSLELMRDGKFLNEDLQARAVLLLHYIATANEQAAEFDLVLQKVI